MSLKQLALALSLAAATSAVAAPITWSANGHEYELVTTGPISWDASRSAAQAKGAGWDLATITSMDEQLFITSLLGPANGSLVEYYIGGAHTAQGWTWVTGEAFSFTYWGVGEPNGNENEPRLTLDGRMQVPNWGWNDFTGEAAFFVNGYVAEFHGAGAVPEPTTLGLFGLGIAGLAFAARRKRA